MRSHRQRFSHPVLSAHEALGAASSGPAIELGEGLPGGTLLERGIPGFLGCLVPAQLGWWSLWAWELGWLASAPGLTTECLSFPTCKMG